jgi:hypothetical protein
MFNSGLNRFCGCIFQLAQAFYNIRRDSESEDVKPARDIFSNPYSVATVEKNGACHHVERHMCTHVTLGVSDTPCEGSHFLIFPVLFRCSFGGFVGETSVLWRKSQRRDAFGGSSSSSAVSRGKGLQRQSCNSIREYSNRKSNQRVSCVTPLHPTRFLRQPGEKIRRQTTPVHNNSTSLFTPLARCLASLKSPKAKLLFVSPS